MIEAELCNHCLWHWLSSPPPFLRDDNYYKTTDPNDKHRPLGKVQTSSRDHPTSWRPFIYIVFLLQREARFVPLSAFCSLKGCFWVLDPNDVYREWYPAASRDGICLVVAHEPSRSLLNYCLDVYLKQGLCRYGWEHMYYSLNDYIAKLLGN